MHNICQFRSLLTTQLVKLMFKWEYEKKRKTNKQHYKTLPWFLLLEIAECSDCKKNGNKCCRCTYKAKEIIQYAIIIYKMRSHLKRIKSLNNWVVFDFNCFLFKIKCVLIKKYKQTHLTVILMYKNPILIAGTAWIDLGHIA